MRDMDSGPTEQGSAYKEVSITLDRGLALLRVIARQENGEAFSISQLASAIGTSRSAVYRLLGPLQTQGFVKRDSAGAVRLGLGLIGLAGQVLPHLRAAATPVLRNLAEHVGATAHLTIADGSEAHAVAVVEPSWTAFHVAYRVGSRHPLDSGAAAHAISLPDNGPPWASSSSEVEACGHGLAAPVPGLPDLRASVGVIALEPLDAELVGPIVLDAAATVSAALQ